MEPLYSMLTYLIVCITGGHAEDVGQIWVLFLHVLSARSTFRGLVRNATQRSMLYIPQNTAEKIAFDLLFLFKD